MNCYCEKKMILDDIGDWNCDKNEEIIATSTEKEDPDQFGIGIDPDGFYVFSCTPAKEYGEINYFGSGASFYPKYCPFCGKKIRDEIKISFMY